MIETASKVISLIGLDGCGKTSHAKLLTRELSFMSSPGCFSAARRRSKYVWYRSPLFFSLPLLLICRILGFSKTRKLPSGAKYVEHQFSRYPIKLLWPCFRLIDLLFVSFISIRIPLMFGKYVVCDRYVPDIVADIVYDTGIHDFIHNRLMRLILGAAPASGMTICLTADEKTILQRREVPDIRYLRQRLIIYNELARFHRVTYVDSTQAFDKVHAQILRVLADRSIYMLPHCLKDVSQPLLTNWVVYQISQRLRNKHYWEIYKKAPHGLLRRLVKVAGAYMFAGNKATHHIRGGLPDLGKDHMGRDAAVGLLYYLQMLLHRKVDVSVLLVVGSRAKGRWTPESDVDTVVILSGISNEANRSSFSDIPLFFGISPEVYTRTEFLEMLKKLDLRALDAILWGVVLYDDGFWSLAQKHYSVLETCHSLPTKRLRALMSRI